jgi:hypothetical protein
MTDNDRTATLAAEITTGWTMDYYSPHNRDDDRIGARIEHVTPGGFTLRPRKPWGSQGRKYPTMNFTWDRDMEVTATADGYRLDIYDTPTSTTSRGTKGVRRRLTTHYLHQPRP